MDTVGRYLLHRQIARGGMATIHIARLMGDEGFNRIVAAKRLLPQLAEDTQFVAMFMDEARIASKVHHPNVVPVLDLVTTADEVMLVQDYVHGVPLHVLLGAAHEQQQKIPIRIAVAIAAEVLAGLEAAHTTVDELGAPLGIIHRDVSPQNIMVAVDGAARLLDFGIAKTAAAAQITGKNVFKGKLAYSAPEQVRGKPVQQSDLYALSVVLWELLVGHRMHGKAKGEAELVATIMSGKIPTITEALAHESDWGAVDAAEWKLLLAVEPIVQKGLAVELSMRWPTAIEMEEELTRAVTPASPAEVAAWAKRLGKEFLDGRDRLLKEEETSWRRMGATPTTRRQRNKLEPVRDSLLGSLRRGGGPMVVVLAAIVLSLAVGVGFALRSSSRATVDESTLGDEPSSTTAANVAAGTMSEHGATNASATTMREPATNADATASEQTASNASATTMREQSASNAPTMRGQLTSPTMHGQPASPTMRGPEASNANAATMRGPAWGANARDRAASNANAATMRGPASNANAPTTRGPASNANARDRAASNANAPTTRGPASNANAPTTRGSNANAPTLAVDARPRENSPPVPAPTTPPRAAKPGGPVAPPPPPDTIEPPAGSDAPTPPPDTPETKPADKSDCNPPYYFVGSKKVFKPNCL